MDLLSPQPDLPKHTYKVLYAVIVVLLLVVILGAIYWWQAEKEQSGQVCIQVVTTAKNPQTGETKDFGTPCEVPSGWVKVLDQEIQTSTWKTYTNTEYGFEFKHPDYTTLNTTSSSKIVLIRFPNNPKPKSIALNIHDTGPIGPCVSPRCKQTDLTIGNIDWKIAYIYDFEEPPPFYAINASTSHNGKYFVFVTLTDENYKDPIFDQILSTFKFTK